MFVHLSLMFHVNIQSSIKFLRQNQIIVVFCIFFVGFSLRLGFFENSFCMLIRFSKKMKGKFKKA